MQQKLDDLCQQVNYTKEHSIAATNKSFTKNVELPLNEASGFDKSQLADSGCWLCDQHCDSFNGLMVKTHTLLCNYVLLIIICISMYGETIDTK